MCVFGRHLYDTDEKKKDTLNQVNPILSGFSGDEFSCLNVADSLNLRVVTLLILM